MRPFNYKEFVKSFAKLLEIVNVSTQAIKACGFMIPVMHNPFKLELTSLISRTLIHKPHTIHHFDVIFDNI